MLKAPALETVRFFEPKTSFKFTEALATQLSAEHFALKMAPIQDQRPTGATHTLGTIWNRSNAYRALGQTLGLPTTRIANSTYLTHPRIRLEFRCQPLGRVQNNANGLLQFPSSPRQQALTVSGSSATKPNGTVSERLTSCAAASERNRTPGIPRRTNIRLNAEFHKKWSAAETSRWIELQSWLPAARSRPIGVTGRCTIHSTMRPLLTKKPSARNC